MVKDRRIIRVYIIAVHVHTLKHGCERFYIFIPILINTKINYSKIKKNGFFFYHHMIFFLFLFFLFLSVCDLYKYC